MSNQKQTVLVTENKAAEEGSPKKGFRLLTSWARWIVESAIAWILASLIWGKLESPLVFDVSLSILSIAALYGTIKLGVVLFFKQVNYLNLYATFYVGLWLYRQLLNAILPTAWIAYWWLPFLFLAPLVLKLPLVDLELANFISRKLYYTLIIVAQVAILPFLLVYTIFHGILHPIQTVSYIKKKVIGATAIWVLIGLITCTIAMSLFFPGSDLLLALLRGIVIYIAVSASVAVFLTFGVLLFSKVDMQKNVRTMNLFNLIEGIIFPFWIIQLAMLMTGINDATKRANTTWDYLNYLIPILLTSISIGLLITTALLKFVPPIVVLSIYWAASIVGSIAEIFSRGKPDFQKTALGKTMTLSILFLLPFYIVSIIAGIRRTQDTQDTQDSQGQVQNQCAGTVIAKEQEAHSEQTG